MLTSRYSYFTLYAVFAVVLVLLFVANLVFGSITVPRSVFTALLTDYDAVASKWKVIVVASRGVQAVTATFAGAALAVSGLMLQTLFCNPLAAPSILGISSGSGVGVALVMLFLGGNIAQLGFSGHLAIVAGATIGALAVLAVIILFSTVVRSSVMLLVVGLMVGYIASSAVSLLSFYATKEGVVSFVVWGMGDFSGVSQDTLLFFVLFVSAGLALSVVMIKPLNALLLGERYSENLGVNMRRTRVLLLVNTGVLTAVVTAFCGPVAFIGLAVPHIARLILGSSNHIHLVPMTLVLGAIVALVCNLLTVIISPGSIIPLNVVTPLMGAPVIIYIIVNKKKIAYFN